MTRIRRRKIAGLVAVLATALLALAVVTSGCAGSAARNSLSSATRPRVTLPNAKSSPVGEPFASATVSGSVPRTRSITEVVFPATKLPRLLPPLARALVVPILMYHYVDASPPLAGPYSAKLTVPTVQFEAEMNYLAVNGYHPVTLEQIYAAMAGQELLPSKPVALTFDDGGLDNYTVAFPILKEHHFPATFFVITGYVGGRVCMNWDQLRTMYAAGMAIESHTVHHPDLRTLDATGLAQELERSRVMLAQQLEENALVLAYPSGAYNAAVIAATQVAGYLVAVTVNAGDALSASSPYTWPRLRVSPGETLAEFARSFEGTKERSHTGTDVE